MASLDFANMTLRDLLSYRRKAIKAGERPSAQNNYLTTTFSTDIKNKQPADWVPTKMFKTWCDHHGPSNHVTTDCRGANRLASKPASDVRRKNIAKRKVSTSPSAGHDRTDHYARPRESTLL